jgi:hypothetical protein
METPRFLDGKLQVHVYPPSSAVTNQVFMRMVAWAERHRPRRKRRLFNFPIFFRWWIAFGLVGFGYSIAIDSQRWEQPARAEARELLAQGLKPEDQQKALELLLAIESGYWTGPRPEGVPRWYWYFAGTTVFVALVLSYPVRTSFALGRGERNVEWQMWYVNALTVALPSAVVAFFVYKLLPSILTDRVKHLLFE